MVFALKGLKTKWNQLSFDFKGVLDAPKQLSSITKMDFV